MEYSPPPLFKQGASARAKVVIFSLIAIFLLAADARWQALGTIRQVVGTGLYPLQRLALMPRDGAYAVGDYFSSVSRLQNENQQYMRQQVANAQALQQSQMMAAENAHLRRLLGASERLPVKSLMAEILYDARDPFTRKIVLDRGSQQGVKAGQPVIDDTGVVGQITRVFPFTAEATLLTDKDQSIPVQVVRSGLRSVAYGRGQSGVLDLRFMPVNADIRKGDILVTSGLDGIYPAGLAVAKVTEVENKSSDAFAKIVCLPAAGIDRHRQLLILLTEYQPPERVQAAQPAATEGKPGVKSAEKPAAKAEAGAAAKPAVNAAPKQEIKPDTKPATQPAAKSDVKPVTPAQGGVPAPAAKPAVSTPAPSASAPVSPANAAGNNVAVVPKAAAGTTPAVPASAANVAPKPAAPVQPVRLSPPVAAPAAGATPSGPAGQTAVPAPKPAVPAGPATPNSPAVPAARPAAAQPAATAPANPAIAPAQVESR